MKHVMRMATCLILAISVLPLNSAFAGEYDDDFATVSTWLGDINGKLALVYSESTNILMQLNQRTISNTYTLRYYIEETYNDQHNMWLQLTTDTQNSTTTIRGYVSNISSKISSVKTSIDNIATDIGTTVTKLTSISTATGNIYSKLGAMQTSDTNYYTMMNNWELSWVAYKNQWLDWGTSWNTSIGTINTNIAAINNNLITGFTSIEGKLDTLHSDLSTANGKLQQLIDMINRVSYYMTLDNGYESWYLKVLPLDPHDGGAITTWVYQVRDYINSIRTKLNTITVNDYTSSIGNIYSAVDGIEGNLNTLHSDLSTANGKLQQIIDWFNRLSYFFTQENGSSIWYLKVLPLDPHDGQAITSWVYQVRDYINSIRTKLNTITVQDYTSVLNNIYNAVSALQAPTVTVDTTAVTTRLDTIIGLLSVPNNTSTIVGDLDSLQFEDDVDDLVDELSNLAPFGSVFLLSSEIGLIVTANTIQTPQFTMPFNFFGQNNVVIDLSWLVSAKPFLNFLMMFLLVYSLAVVSMKYARNEATS